MAGVRVVLTYRDYATLPNDGRRYEIHAGELSVTPAPKPKHQDILGALFVALRAYVVERGLGKVLLAPLDVILDDTSVVQPDIVYVATDRLGRISERGIEGAPTLAIEILSPSTRTIDRHTKMQLYARHGIPWYWLVDPDGRTVEIFALEAETYALRTRADADQPLRADLFPDLTIPLGSLWP